MKTVLIAGIASLLMSSVALAGTSLAPSAEATKPLGVGTKVPSVNVVNAQGETVDLASAIRGKPTVLIFYRGGWCPFCNKHLASLAELEPDIIAKGYQVVAVCPDTHEAVKEAVAKTQPAHTLYSDRNMEASAAYGLAFRVDPATQEKYKQYGFDLAPVPGEPDARWLPVPAAYVIAADGTVRFVYANPDYRVRVTSESLMAAVDAALKS